MTVQSPHVTLCELQDPGIDRVESYSPFCLKVHRALRFAGLQYERRLGNAPADFKHLNPAAQVPVLLVDGEAIADSTRILQRIEAISGAFTRGLDERARAEAWLWEDFADSALNGFVVAARWAHDEQWPALRDAYFGGAPWFVRQLIAPKVRKHVLAGLVARDVLRRGLDACWQRFVATLDTLEARAPEHAYWIGPTLTVADLAIFAQLHSLRTPLTPAYAEQLAERRRLSSYLDRVHATTSALGARRSDPRVVRAQVA